MLKFSQGSVHVDSKTAAYNYDNAEKLLSVELGDIAPGKTKTVTFEVVVETNAYGQSFKNTAIANADNSTDTPGTDGGVTIEDGKGKMTVEKSVNKSKAKVGDTLVYIVKVSNSDTATVPLENVTIKDNLPEFVKFTQGSVHVDGKTADYNYNNETGLLTVELGDITPDSAKTVTFDCVVDTNAYGQSFKNIAIANADNSTDTPGGDGGVEIEDGTAKMSITKAVDKDKAKVGDTLVYTVSVTNADAATVNLKETMIDDVLPEYVTFTHGSVQVDALSANYSYDNSKRLLNVPLFEIAPGQTKVVTFECVVNSTAYGKTFNNTAIAKAENDDDKPDTDGGTAIDVGTPEGSAGAKTVSASTAKVGDTLTYTITLRNASTATSEWKAEVKDAIPEHLSFVNGSVEEEGRSSTNFSYDANSKTLSLFADSIAIGADKKFTFKVTVDDGAQGLYIVNTAVVSSEDRDDIQLPDTGVQIDGGKTEPAITKTASVKEAHEGDIFSYTVTMKNGGNATADWKNIILTDVIPDGLKLVAGTVTLNDQTVSYGVNGDAIEVTVGNLPKNTEAVVKFEVRVLEDAVGKTIKNVATAKGDNGEKTATDEGVKIPKPGNPGGPDQPDDNKIVTGSKDVDKTLVKVQENVTFTITAKNNSDEVWEGVQVYDVLDSSMVTLITDMMYIDGIKYPESSGKWSFADKQLVFTLGDIEPGKEVVCKFTVQIKNDAGGHTYVNNATLKGTDGKTVYVKSPEIMIENGIRTDSDIHYRLFAGIGDSFGNPLFLWGPNDDIKIDHMFIVGYRLMTDDYRKSVGNGTHTVPGNVTSREAQYFISNGIISAAEYSSGADATQSQVYRILNATVGANLNSNSTTGVKRADVARLICNFSKRDDSPDTNGLPLANFTDKGAFALLIDEVSNGHDYTKDSAGNETWVSLIKD